MIVPSCPAFVVCEDDPFRRALIAALDQRHFTVTFAADGAGALKTLQERAFRVLLLGVDLTAGKGLTMLDYLRDHRPSLACRIILVGDPNPELRSYRGLADETLLRPVDAEYVADRARVYCR